MNLSFTEEQTMLQDSVARFVSQHYSFDKRQKYVETEEGFSRENWRTFAELGWLSTSFPEDQGGFGGDTVDTMLLMEQLGRGLVVEPFIATVLLFGGLLSKTKSRKWQSTLDKIVDGSLLGAFAYVERQSRFELFNVKTAAVKEKDSFIINGEKTVVFNGAVAEKIIVSARTSGEQSDTQGISLFLIDTNAKGLKRVSYRLMDGQLVANVHLDNVKVACDQVVGDVDQGHALMKLVVTEAMLHLSAEALGVMQKLNATTVEYSKTREQFGASIGSYQVLQHRMVDMLMAYEQTKSLLYRAVCSLAHDSENVTKDILALKVMVGRAGKLIGDGAIQIHGGMGLSDELDVGHYVKRLMMIDTCFGNADYQQQLFSAVAN